MGARALILLVALALPAFARFEVLRGQVDGRPVRAWLAAPPRLGVARLEWEGAVRPVSVTCDMPAMPRMAARVFPFTGPAAAPEFTMKGLWRLDFRFANERHLSARVTVQGGAGSSGTLGCGPGVPAEAALRVQVLDGRLRAGENRLRLELPPQPSPSETIPVSVQMPAMPMAVPVRAARRQADGSYAVSVPLTMPGVWHLWAELEGRPLGPVVLVLGDPQRTSVSLVLLGLTLLAAWPLRRQLPALLVIAAALVAGLYVERYHPVPEAMGMDMRRPDLGMGEMTAPLPVLEATVTRRALELAQKYPVQGQAIRVPVADRERFWPGRAVQVDGRPGRVTNVSGWAEGGLLAVWVEPAGRTVTLPEPVPLALCVPRAAVQGSSVYVIEEVARVRTARRRRVSLGRSDASFTQVLSGLREGEVVVAQAEAGLRDGTVVTSGTWGSGPYRRVLVPAE